MTSYKLGVSIFDKLLLHLSACNFAGLFSTSIRINCKSIFLRENGAGNKNSLMGEGKMMEEILLLRER